MPHAHPLALGTFIRSERPVMDEGDYGERYAAAGAVGEIVRIDPDDEHRFRYSVQFLPSGISTIELASELDQHAVVLPAGSNEIPSPAVRELARAVLEAFYDSQVVDEDQVVIIEPVTARRLEQAGASMSTGIRSAINAVLAARPAGVSFALIDDLAAAAGVADRLTPSSPAPSP
ncbi:hypothetical protein [Bosea sp. ANAM02]|uniref:hypothetical protein n=1 Tax=Bosea sp. ANAM02 TaxID=2020412 RepID=UPI00140ED852|nr:hypothetical protein [Bosea sp. ANAM02]BCB22252.1 hypothetical protein OCUBac02_51460 [Bosea sp. ANAM02]